MVLPAVIVTVAALADTLLTEDVTPVGATPGVKPSTAVNHDTAPVAPFAMFAVVTSNEAFPAVPAVNVPLCAATETDFIKAAGPVVGNFAVVITPLSAGFVAGSPSTVKKLAVTSF